MTKKNQNRLWFAIVLGFLGFGIIMIIWTVKQAVSMPVQESNNFMLKYQMADMNINTIIEAQKEFDKNYTLELQNKEVIQLDEEDQNTNSKLNYVAPIKLIKGENYFSYRISKSDGTSINDANVTFLLTRPHTRKNDSLQKSVDFKDGSYTTQIFNITEAGRYTLQIRAYIDAQTIGYSEIAAYLKPQ